MKVPLSPWLTLLLGVACAHRAAPIARPHAPAPPLAVDAGAPAPVVVGTPVPPESAPAAFRSGASEVDVDRDGLADRAARLPAMTLPGSARSVRGPAPPPLVAHRRADGRYDVDDPVTRAALRALCPEAPVAALVPAVYGAEPLDRASALRTEGFCALAWGRGLDDVVRSLRSLVGDASAATFSSVEVEAAIAALRTTAPPLTLRPLAPVALTLGPRPPAAPAATAPTAAPPPVPVDAACARVHAANVRLALAANRQTAAMDPQPIVPEEPDGPDCLAAAGQAWALVWTRAAPSPEGPSIEVVGRLAPLPAPRGARPLAVTARFGAFATESVSLRAIFDWDGDGSPEVAVRVASWEHEGESAARLEIYTLRGGAVTRFAPAALFTDLADLADADGDGRPDFVLPTRWSFTDGCGMNGVRHDGPTMLAHALPDGSFSTTDDVARAWVLRGCERIYSEGPDALGPHDLAVYQVACARTRGMDPEAIVAALRGDALHAERPREVPGNNDQEVCYPFQDLASLALIASPFGAAP